MDFLFDEGMHHSIRLLWEHKPKVLGEVLGSLPKEYWEYSAISSSKKEDYKGIYKNFFEKYKEKCADKYFSHDWFTYKAWAWPHILNAVPKSENPQILEIGVFEGRSVIFVLEYLPTSNVTAIDHFVLKQGWTSSQNITLKQDSEATFRGNVQSYGDRVRTIVRPSWDGLSTLVSEQQKYDFIYIDASHTATDVVIDSALSWKMLNVGGIMLWDDIMLDIWHWEEGPTGAGVLKFLEIIAGKFEWVHAGWQIAIRKTAEISTM